MVFCDALRSLVRYPAAFARKSKRSTRQVLHTLRHKPLSELPRLVLATRLQTKIKVLILVASVCSVSISLTLKGEPPMLDEEAMIQVRLGERTFTAYLEKYKLDAPQIKKTTILSNGNKCYNDCLRIKELLWDWPIGKPMAAFYMLTKRNRLSLLLKALKALYDNFNAQYDYPVIIFHEQDVNVTARETIKKSTKNKVFLQDIQFESPLFLKRPIPLDISCSSSLGYRHMCRFHAIKVYEEPIIRGFQYLCRLDDDSLITSQVNYDMFKFMATNNITYGYKTTAFDQDRCTIGLWEATSYFANISTLLPQFFSAWKRNKIFYNNFEVSQTDLWLSQEYGSFIHYLDKLGGIYYHRWGDAPIKALAVSLFVPLSRTHQFRDIGYTHGAYIG